MRLPGPSFIVIARLAARLTGRPFHPSATCRAISFVGCGARNSYPVMSRHPVNSAISARDAGVAYRRGTNQSRYGVVEAWLPRYRYLGTSEAAYVALRKRLVVRSEGPATRISGSAATEVICPSWRLLSFHTGFAHWHIASCAALHHSCFVGLNADSDGSGRVSRDHALAG